MIKELYTEYTQKSKLFLYPGLDIKRGSDVTPIDTYVSWDGLYSLEDCKLICVYHIRKDSNFKSFEKIKLMNNPRFYDFHYLGNDKGAYVFDFSDLKEDFKHIVESRYSKISETYKKKILSYYTGVKAHKEYMESYLYPEKHYDTYAKLLSVSNPEPLKQALKETVELCTKIDLEKENLKLEVKTI